MLVLLRLLLPPVVKPLLPLPLQVEQHPMAKAREPVLERVAELPLPLLPQPAMKLLLLLLLRAERRLLERARALEEPKPVHLLPKVRARAPAVPAVLVVRLPRPRHLLRELPREAELKPDLLLPREKARVQVVPVRELGVRLLRLLLPPVLAERQHLLRKERARVLAVPGVLVVKHPRPRLLRLGLERAPVLGLGHLLARVKAQAQVPELERGLRHRPWSNLGCR